jgi:hypothetical protein
VRHGKRCPEIGTERALRRRERGEALEESVCVTVARSRFHEAEGPSVNGLSRGREESMDMKREGAAFPPVPVGITDVREAMAKGATRAVREGGEPRCEMCGYSVIASHCKRICLRCGFMTGCSEGI